MLNPWSQRLLTLLQLTRMALVFTAIADAWCGLFLWGSRRWWTIDFGQLADVWRLLTLAGVSVGLYGFGMSLNDIIDRRRDRQISPGRPLPSGRVSVVAAHVVCFLLLLIAFGCAVLFRASGGPSGCLVLTAATAVLIWFYDSAGKYLVGPGLVTLGLVRFCQCMIGAADPPDIWHPLVWHPLWLLDHVAILSAVCYAWEEKRPQLNARHWIGLTATLLALNVAAVLFVRWYGHDGRPEDLPLDWRLAGPVAASLIFVAVARYIRRKSPTIREAGQATMLYGLLWLIVYDAVFAGLYAHWGAGVLLLMLLPMAWMSVKVMRGWSKLVAASQRPEFKRAGVG